jgi:hypothetical protein
MGFSIQYTSGKTTDYNNICWKILLGIPGVIAAFRFLIFYVLVRKNTPKYLVNKGEDEDALNSLRIIYTEEEAN